MRRSRWSPHKKGGGGQESNLASGHSADSRAAVAPHPLTNPADEPASHAIVCQENHLCQYQAYTITANDLQLYCSQLAKEFAFAAKYNSSARQAAADQAWTAIFRFYDCCKAKQSGK